MPETRTRFPREPWRVFPSDGNWTTDASWTDALAAVHPSVDAQGALRALGLAFPAPWALRENEADEKHPVAHLYVWRRSRFELLDIGLALKDGPRDRHTLRRLRSASTFYQTCTELWVGTMLRSSGAIASYEPSRHAARRGPDWVASWEGEGIVAVEVKTPRLSDVDRRLRLASAEFMHALGFGLHGRFLPAQRVICEVRLALRITRNLTKRGIDDDLQLVELARRLGTYISQEIPRVVPPTSTGGVYLIDRVAEILLTPIAGEPGFQLQGPVFQAHEAHDLSRLWTMIADAAHQLSTVNAPGVVVVDVRDVFVSAPLRRALEERLSSGALGDRGPRAVLLRWGSARIDARVPYNGVYVLQGPGFADLPPRFWSAFTRCPVGHLHFEPLRDPAEPYGCSSPEVEWL